MAWASEQHWLCCHSGPSWNPSPTHMGAALRDSGPTWWGKASLLSTKTQSTSEGPGSFPFPLFFQVMGGEKRWGSAGL